MMDSWPVLVCKLFYFRCVWPDQPNEFGPAWFSPSWVGRLILFRDDHNRPQVNQCREGPGLIPDNQRRSFTHKGCPLDEHCSSNRNHKTGPTSLFPLSKLWGVLSKKNGLNLFIDSQKEKINFCNKIWPLWPLSCHQYLHLVVHWAFNASTNWVTFIVM